MNFINDKSFVAKHHTLADTKSFPWNLKCGKNNTFSGFKQYHESTDVVSQTKTELLPIQPKKINSNHKLHRLLFY